MSRLFVEARAPISFNLFSSACKRLLDFTSLGRGQLAEP